MNSIAADRAKPGAGLFRVRQILDNVEAKPVSIAPAWPATINPPASKRYYFWLMAPAVALLAFISIYPFFWMIYMGLHDVEIGSVVWNDFANFTRLAERFALCRRLGAAVPVQRHVPGAADRHRRVPRSGAERIALREDPGDDALDAHDDGAPGRRHGLVLPLQRHLRLVSLAAAERRHPRSEIHSCQPRAQRCSPSSSSTCGSGRR